MDSSCLRTTWLRFQIKTWIQAVSLNPGYIQRVSISDVFYDSFFIHMCLHLIVERKAWSKLSDDELMARLSESLHPGTSITLIGLMAMNFAVVLLFLPHT